MLKTLIMGFFMPAVTLIKGSKFDPSQVDYRDSVPVNMYGVLRDELGSSGYMYQLPGLTDLTTGSGVDRGAIYVTAEGLEGQYRVTGTDLVLEDGAGNLTVLGTIPGDEQAVLDFSFNNVMIVANLQLFYYNPTAGFREITSGVLNPISVAFVAQFVVLTDGARIYHSQILDEEAFPANNEAVAEFVPDKTLALKKNEDNELVAFGSRSTEHFVFNSAATSGFAFVPLDLKGTKLGIVGTRAVNELDGAWFTVGRRDETATSCYMYSAGTGQKIASREIEIVLKNLTQDELLTVTIDAITIDDVKLVFYHFPNETYLFNATIAQSQGVGNSWSKLTSDVSGGNYRARNFVLDPRSSEWVVGDKLGAKIGIFDRSVATHYGVIAEFLLFTAFLKLETLSIDNMEIEIIPGIVDAANDATVMVSRTDNGRTHGQEWTEEYGAQYDYDNRFIIRNFGYVRHWVGFKFRGASRSRMAFGLFTVEAS